MSGRLRIYSPGYRTGCSAEADQSLFFLIHDISIYEPFLASAKHLRDQLRLYLPFVLYALGLSRKRRTRPVSVLLHDEEGLSGALAVLEWVHARLDRTLPFARQILLVDFRGILKVLQLEHFVALNCMLKSFTLDFL